MRTEKQLERNQYKKRTIRLVILNTLLAWIIEIVIWVIITACVCVYNGPVTISNIMQTVPDTLGYLVFSALGSIACCAVHGVRAYRDVVARL